MRLRTTVSIALAALVVSAPALAYRPFEGTDADVAELGEFELEFGPINYIDETRQKALVAPATVLNLGIVRDWELVVDARNQLRIGSGASPRDRVLDTDVLLKTVLRDGVMQGKTGLSAATEFGVLTPEYHGEKRFGAIDTLIISWRTDLTTLHLNNAISYSRNHTAQYIGSLIIEGPPAWSVRPVTELYVSREHAGTREEAALLGVLWRASPRFTFDAALRGALVDAVPVRETRVGLTWVTDVWDPN